MILDRGTEPMVYGQMKLLNTVGLRITHVNDHVSYAIKLTAFLAYHSDDLYSLCSRDLRGVKHVRRISRRAYSDQHISTTSEAVKSLGVNEGGIFIVHISREK